MNRTTPDDFRDWPRTFGVIAEGVHEGWHSGGQVRVSLQGRVLLSAAFGERRPGEPLTRDTLCLWRSSGKPLTAFALALLCDRGRLDLDEPVIAHLPEFAAGGKASITPRHLLTHTAGFGTADHLPESLPWVECIAAICATPLAPAWTVGVDAGYQAVSSWYVLAEIVRRLDGRDFPEFLRHEILLPLGMPDTWVGMPPSEHERYGVRIGTTYRTFPGPAMAHPSWDTAEDCARCRPGANARGPVAELGLFYEAVLAGGKRIVRPETLTEFTRRQRVGRFDVTFRHVVDFGLGFLVNSRRYGPDTVPYGYGRHASEETFGHSGAQSSCGFADPERGLVVTWVFNGAPGEPRHQRRQRAMNEAIYEDLGLAG